ncbi:MAG TPA: Uma2 family endonuclease [Humisphaera sp.]|jgi:Uma2 family endonuclease|nr:Uma2 family endonuclease [Humisphaera sp.]
MAGTTTHPQRSRSPQPAWEIARIYPDQGCWDESDYLELDTNHLIEFSDGFVEVLPMPTQSHQLIVQFLSNALLAFVTAGRLGRVLFAPLRVRLRKGRYREPDVVFMLAAHKARMREKYWDGADLVMEVVSDDPESRERDLVTKRTEYAAAGIAEYWIVDPQERRVTVLALQGKRYAVHGEFRPGQRATSRLLHGFSVNVSATFAAGK